MDNKKNILITGASGFIGHALVKKLIQKNVNLFLVARNKKFTLTPKFLAPGFRCPKAKVFYGDLGNFQFCKKILKNINTVYYLAGYKKNIAWHVKYPYEFLEGNLQPLLVFLKALKKSKVKQLIYLSSTHVNYIKLDEQKLDGYTLGKYANELAIKSFAKEYNIDVKIIRTTAVYGPCDDFNPETANFIPAMIDRIYKSHKELIVWGKGIRKVELIYVDDLADNLIAAAKNKKLKSATVGNSRAISVDNIVKKIIKLMHKDLSIKYDPAKPDKPTKVEKFNNFVKSKISLDQGFKTTIDYYITHITHITQKTPCHPEFRCNGVESE
ncbi:MAG: NAD(P)-dependent oxidoreductase [Candidatus Kuenenbacteria bacterium]